MEHLFHVFIPGTEENIALQTLLPALAPFQAWVACWVNDLLTTFHKWAQPGPLTRSGARRRTHHIKE